MKRRNMLKILMAAPAALLMPRIGHGTPAITLGDLEPVPAPKGFSLEDLQTAYNKCCEEWPKSPDQLNVASGLYALFVGYCQSHPVDETPGQLRVWNAGWTHYVYNMKTREAHLFVWLDDKDAFRRGLPIKEIPPWSVRQGENPMSPFYSARTLNDSGPEGSGSGMFYSWNVSGRLESR